MCANPQSIEVRDLRDGFFWINSELIDDYAPKIGGTALLVYCVLCRFANNKTAECFPSQGRLAKLCGVEERTVRRSLIKLIEAGLIAKDRERGDGGEFSRNVYTLLRVQPTKMSSGPADIQPPDITTGHQAPTNNTYLELDSVKELDSSASRETETLEPTSEPTTKSNPSSDRNEAMDQLRERNRLADERKAQKEAGKGRGLRYKQYNRKSATSFPVKESGAEIRARKNSELLSGLSLTDEVREALGDAGEAFKQDLTPTMVKLWKTDLQPFPDELIVAAFAEFRRREVQWFPKSGEILAILERLSKPVKETALERQQRENRERRARNAEEAATTT